MKSKNKDLKPQKKVRMIEVRGITGLLKLLYIGICLVAGFAVFPGVALMYLWNTFLAPVANIPAIDLLQGFLLYAIFVTCYMIYNKPRFSISCGSFGDLSDEELEQIFIKAKADADRRMRMSGVELCQSKLDEIEKLKSEKVEEKEKEEV